MFNLLNGLVAEASSLSIDWSNIIKAETFEPVLDGISAVLPIVAPVGFLIASIPVIIRLCKKLMKG